MYTYTYIYIIYVCVIYKNCYKGVFELYCTKGYHYFILKQNYKCFVKTSAW